MRTLFVVMSLLLASIPVASAWAILLNSPSFLYPAGASQEDIKTTEATMKGLEFEGGVIHVSAPQPTRSLRFGAPGQSLEDLLPQLTKLGFSVTVSFSNKLGKQSGFVIQQSENGSDQLTVVINSAHPDLDLEKLSLKLGR